MYLIHFICFGFFLKVRAITQDLVQTSVNLRGDEVVYTGTPNENIVLNLNIVKRILVFKR